MRNRMSRFVLAVVACALASASAQAQSTYYVRKTGSDSNAGTSPGSAYKTIDKAADTATAGATIYVGAGTYTETVTPSNDGTAGSPIVYVADTSGAQTGDAGEVIIRRTGNGQDVLVVDSDNYLTFRGFIIEDGRDTITWDNSVGGVLENCVIRGSFDDLIEVSGNSELTIRGCTISDVGDDAVDVNSGDVTVESTTFDDVSDNVLYLSDSGGSLVARRCTVSNAGSGAFATGGTLTLVNCVFYDIDDDAVRGEGSTTLHIYNCTIDDTGADGVRSWGTANVYNNIFTNIGDDGMDKEGSTFNASHNLVWNYGGSRSEGFNSTEFSFDPDYVSVGTGDYRLNAGSGAIDIAQDVSSTTGVDRLNAPRPAGSGWDLGAYEYGAFTYFASVPYITDFESGAGLEWSDRTTTTLEALTEYLGRYELQDATTLSVDSMAAGETYYLFFDLYVIDNWEGAGSSQDDFTITIDGAQVFNETFDNTGVGQTYPGSPALSGTNIGYDSHVDSTYRRIYLSFVADDATAIIRFESDMTADMSNESWGLDEVMVLHEDDAQAYIPLFTNVSAATGFDVYNSAQVQRASGLHWADLDGDGDMDAVTTGESSRVMRYDANSDAFSAATIGGGGLWRAGAFLDADGDGDLDFFAACDSSYYVEGLYTNSWPAAMSYAGSAGVSDPSNNEGIAACDIDNDGWTDLVMFSENGNWRLLSTHDDPANFVASDDPAIGLNDAGSVGNGAFVSSGDANNDGYMDFYYHYNKGVLLLSDGAGAYISTTPVPGSDPGNNEKTGSAWGDYDNDGDLDLYIPFRSGGGRLYRNDAGTFVNIAASAGITDTAAQSSASWGDFDNDWDLDLLVATEDGDPLLLYENQGDGTFVLVDKGAAIGGNAHDAVFVDYDSDGDLDIAATREDDTNILLRNDTDDAAYLKVRVLRTVGGVDIEQVGVRVELWDQAMTSVMARRDIGVARGFGGSEPVWAHFGGVDPGLLYNVKVVWPGGDETVVEVMPGAAISTFGAVTVPQMLTVTGKTGSLRVTRWREVKAVSDD